MMYCKMTNCGKPTVGRGLCRTHYQAWMRQIRKGSKWSATEEVNFWGKVEKTCECWQWIGGVDKGGYGIISINAYPTKAHRFFMDDTQWYYPVGDVRVASLRQSGMCKSSAPICGLNL